MPPSAGPSSTTRTRSWRTCAAWRQCTGARSSGRGWSSPTKRCTGALRPGPLAHDRIEVNTRGIPEAALAGYAPLVTHVSNWLGFTDPPKHTRMREIGRHLVNPGMAHKFRPWTLAFVNDVMTRIQAQDHLDLVEEVALRLPLELICEALGIHDDDVRRFHDWSGDLGLFAARMSPEWDAGSRVRWTGQWPAGWHWRKCSAG